MHVSTPAGILVCLLTPNETLAVTDTFCFLERENKKSVSVKKTSTEIILVP